MDRFLYINSLLSTPNGLANSKVEILKASIEFVTAFEHPSTPVGEKGVLDEMRPILSSLRDSTCPAELELRFASIMKILLRKAVNRDNIGKFGMSSIVQCIGRQQLIGSLAAAELGNVVLNACFDSQNVMLYLGENGLPPLLNLLRCPDSAVQASVLGALQGICFTPAGKYSLRSKDEAIAKIMMFMISDNMTVRARAVGTIHNLSADPVAISAIRELNNYSGIPMLISLLHDPSPELCHAAAGALQNLSRDNTARKIIVSIPEALPRLIDLLFGSDVKCQLAAVGAVINIMGPMLKSKERAGLRNYESGSADGDLADLDEDDGQGDENFELLKSVLSDAIALGAIRSCIFDRSST